MTPQEQETKIKQIICEQLEISMDQVKPEASFLDDLKADSLEQVELMMALEAEFKLEIPQEDMEQIKTVKDAVNYIQTHAK